MIQIKKQQLIITIPCSNNNPLELLGEMQEALQNIFQLIDYKNSSKEMVEFSTQQLSKLLKNISISNDQLCVIGNEILSNKELQKHF